MAQDATTLQYPREMSELRSGKVSVVISTDIAAATLSDGMKVCSHLKGTGSAKHPSRFVKLSQMTGKDRSWLQIALFGADSKEENQLKIFIGHEKDVEDDGSGHPNTAWRTISASLHEPWSLVNGADGGIRLFDEIVDDLNYFILSKSHYDPSDEIAFLDYLRNVRRLSVPQLDEEQVSEVRPEWLAKKAWQAEINKIPF